MNALEQLLQEDLNHLVDRIAATVPTGMIADCAERRPELTIRLGDAEARLSTVRQSLLHDYGMWRQALQECGDLWALVDARAEVAVSPPDERRAA
jgi:hypothetical protein